MRGRMSKDIAEGLDLGLELTSDVFGVEVIHAAVELLASIERTARGRDAASSGEGLPRVSVR